MTHYFFWMKEMYSIKNKEELENLKELVSLENQVNEVRLQDKLGKQNFHYNTKKVFDRVIDTIEDTYEKITKTLTESSIETNQILDKLNNKLLEKLNDRGIIASYSLSSLSKVTNPENTTQFILV